MRSESHSHAIRQPATSAAAVADLSTDRYVRGVSASGIVHIVDDDAQVRASLDSLIRSVGGSARQYATTAEFLAAEQADAPSCMLLDVRLPGMSGLDFQDSLRARGIRIPVILMTAHGDIQMSVRGMKAGAVDFLTKPFRAQDVLDAVAAALERDGQRRVRDAELSGIRARYETLTSRERQVAELVTLGRLNKEVAAQLSLSEITIKIHRRSVMKKMGAASLADLVKMTEALKTRGDVDGGPHEPPPPRATRQKAGS
jgi:FixJ family two-component response regulator